MISISPAKQVIRGEDYRFGRLQKRMWNKKVRRDSIVDVFNTHLPNNGASVRTHVVMLSRICVQHIVFDGRIFVAAAEDRDRHQYLQDPF